MQNTNVQNNFDSIIKERSGKSAKPYSLSKTYPAYIVLIVMLGLSFFIYNNVKSQIESDLNEQFDKSVNSIMGRLNNQFQNKYSIVKSTSGIYKIVDFVVRDYFDLYGTVPAKTYPSILSIAYIDKVKDENLSDYISYTSTQGYFDYSFKAKDKKNLYYAIHHILPYPFNGHRLGIDMSEQPEFFSSAMKAVTENKIVATESYISRSNDTLCFFMIAPVYAYEKPISTIDERIQNMVGFLAMELNSKVYFEEALTGKTNETEASTFPSDSLVYFKVVDKNSRNEDYVVYKSDNFSKIEANFNPLKKAELDYTVADRNLKIEFATIPNFGGNISESLPIATLSISLILSFLFFGFVLSVTTSRARAVAIADKMTESQRRIVESSQDVIGVVDTDGLWLSANNATNSIFNIGPEAILKTSVFNMVIEDFGLQEFFEKAKKSNKNIDDRISVKIKFQNSFKWVNWNLSYVAIDNLIYVTGRDITLEKIAEEEALLKTKQIKLAEMYALEASESKTYFMKKLSHQLRNSLTGILGYLQLISNKLYDTEEELDQYVTMAEQSSEEIFNFVSDIVDATLQTGAENNLHLGLVNVGKSFVDSFNNFKKVNSHGDPSIDISEASLNSKAVADVASLRTIYNECLLALSSNVKNMNFTVEIQENPYEGATEIQIMTSPNLHVKDLIQIFKDHPSDIINYLQQDKYDFLFKLSNIASIVRRLNGSFGIDYLGDNDGSLISILLPRNKQID